MSARKAQRAAVAVLAVAGLVPLGAAGVPAAAGPQAPAVVVNEVSQRVNPDWVELHNPGDATADLSGWRLQDDQDRGPEDYVFPAGTVIPAGWYLVVDAADDGTTGFGFGLGAADTVRLSDAGGSLVDSLSWTEHAATTYGRCPDGSGEVRQTAAPTRGEANDCTSPLRVNEVAAGFVELVNPSGAGVELGGHVVRAAGAEDGHALPDGVLAPGGLLLIEADALGFAPGEASGVELVDGAGAVADSHGWEIVPEPSTGRCPDGVGAFTVTAAATPGEPNDCVPVAGQDAVKVNEVESSDGVPGDWIELVNTGAEPVDLSGWLVRDNDDTRFSTIAAGTVIAPAASTCTRRPRSASASAAATWPASTRRTARSSTPTRGTSTRPRRTAAAPTAPASSAPPRRRRRARRTTATATRSPTRSRSRATRGPAART